MKKIIIAIALLISGYTFSQGNLQFNRVATNSITTQTRAGSGIGDVIGQITVPNGKALKIEAVSVISNRLDSNLRYLYGYQNGANVKYNFALIDGHLVWRSTYSAENNSNASTLPLWLGEGTHEITLKTNTDNNAALFSYSALEFNIVQ